MGPFGQHQHMNTQPTACAKHCNGFTRLDPGVTDDLHRCRDGIRDNADFGWMGLPIQRFGQFEEVFGRQFHQFGVSAIAGAADIPAKILAHGLPVDPAPLALPAGQVKICRDRVTDFHVCHTGADRLDNARNLMADDPRVVDLCAAGFDMLDCQAGTAGQDFRHRFSGAGCGVSYGFQGKRLVGAVQDKCFHQE